MPENSKEHGERLARIEQKLDDLSGRLFGENGQPGMLYRHDESIKQLETFRWKAAGILTALSACSGLCAHKVLKMFGVSI
jgi:hypothetical protein